MRSQKHLHQNESGLVSLIVTMIMVLVISLIVMAFFRVSQREQRQALDRQLNTQAFYAAEAGINDAMDAIEKGLVLPASENNCNPLPSPAYTNQVGADPSITYSCLLIDATPTTLEYTNIERGTSKVMPLERSGGGSISSVQIFWQDADGNSTFSGCPSGTNNVFPSTWSATCGPGIMRVDIVPVPAVGIFQRSNLIDQTMTAFAVPQRSGGVGMSVTYSTGGGGRNTGFPFQGSLLGGACTTAVSPTNPKNCRLTISGLSGSRYYMRLTPLYKNAAVTICAPNCTNPVDLIGAQTTIDATGKANDVLKRIQVRVPNENTGYFPVNALESAETLCKRFGIAPGAAGPIVIADPTPGCQVP